MSYTSATTRVTVTVDELAKILSKTRLKKRNVCGSERKRRKKARAAAAATFPSSQTTGSASSGAAQKTSGFLTGVPGKQLDLRLQKLVEGAAQGSKTVQSTKRPPSTTTGIDFQRQSTASKRPRTVESSETGGYTITLRMSGPYESQ